MARPSSVWFRNSTNSWFVTHNGVKTNLYVKGRQNEAAAWKAFERLKAGNLQPTITPLPTPTTSVTVQQVIAEFLADATNRVSTETLTLYQYFCDGFLRKYGTTVCDQLTGPTVEAYSRNPNPSDPKRPAPDWNASTRSAFLAVVIRAFRFAVRSRLIDRNPISDVKRPQIAHRTEEVLVTEQEHQRLCAVAPPLFRQFIQFLYLTGCRPGECSQLEAADVNLEGPTATIRKHKTAKYGVQRTVYLPPDAVEMLRLLISVHPTGVLFRNKVGRQWTKANWGMAMREARTRAGLPKKVTYGFRHTFCTDALAAGVSDATVAILLGHANTNMIHKFYSKLGSRTRIMTEAVKKVR